MTKDRRLAIALAVAATIPLAMMAAILSQAPAHAQGAQVYHSFLLTARGPNIVATPQSQNLSLGLPSDVTAPVARVCNSGPVLAYVAVGNTTVVADPALSMPVRPGECVSLNATGATNIAAITDPNAGDTPTLLVMLGSGSP
jgi:hypothetical protein